MPHMAETQPSSWRERALAVCMAAHDRLGASCPQAVRSVASSPDLVCAIMWHVFPYGAPLVVKVQYAEVRELFASDFDQVIAACKFWDTRVLASYSKLVRG